MRSCFDCWHIFKMHVLFHLLVHCLFLQFEEPRDIVDDNGDGAKPVESVQLSEEVNGSHEYGEEDESTVHEVENEYDDEEDEDVDDEEEDPSAVSIGKKIFKFFTT